MKDILFAGLTLVAVVVAFIVWLFVSNPDAGNIKGCLVAEMNQVSLCPKDRGYTPLGKIAPVLVQTVLISEDAAFYSHQGFDWQEIKNSFVTNLERGRYARGGSTITQQLVKNVFLTRKKSILRKVREAILASQVEALLTKQEILERYLNVIEWGPGVFGVRQASQYYFQKSPRELHFLEAAYLSYLLPNPPEYSETFRDQELSPYAKKRVMGLSRKLVLYKKISQMQYSVAQDLIAEFPWHSLSSYDIARLKGEGAEFDWNLANDLIIDQSLLSQEQLKELEGLDMDFFNSRTQERGPAPEELTEVDDETGVNAEPESPEPIVGEEPSEIKEAADESNSSSDAASGQPAAALETPSPESLETHQ